MLKKLLKYDLKYMLKNMIPFYLLALFFGLTTRIIFSLNQTVIVNIIGQISVGCLFSMLANILINTIMRSWIRFRDSIYKDESYLTHTLPVTKNDIYNSKFLQTLIFFIISFIVVLLSLFIAYYTKDRWLILTTLINSMTQNLNLNTTLFILGLITVIFLEVFNAIQSGFLGIILGNQKNNNKTAFSIIYGFIAYLLSQCLVLVAIFIIALFNKDIMNLFQSNVLLTTQAYKLLIFIAIVVYLLVIALMNLICKKEFNKGVNVE